MRMCPGVTHDGEMFRGDRPPVVGDHTAKRSVGGRGGICMEARAPMLRGGAPIQGERRLSI